MCIHLHGSWLFLIGNVQINFGVIWHFVLSLSYLVDNQKCWNLTRKFIICNYKISSCRQLTFYLFLEKVLTIVLISFSSNPNMNSTTDSLTLYTAAADGHITARMLLGMLWPFCQPLHQMFHCNFGKRQSIFKILSPEDSPSKRAMYTNKDSHLTWSVLLHYLIKARIQTCHLFLLTLTMNCCCVQRIKYHNCDKIDFQNPFTNRLARKFV